MGTLVVRALATSPPRAPATITATRRSIKSAANTGNCASWSSAKRYSIARFLPSTKPVSRSPRLKASRTVAASARDRGWRTPIVNCVGCCARAASGQAATEPTVTLMKSRRRIAFLKASDHANRISDRDVRFVPKADIGTAKKASFNHRGMPLNNGANRLNRGRCPASRKRTLR